jgi:hypothetical protein
MNEDSDEDSDETFALTDPTRPKDVDVWGHQTGKESPSGSFRFSVINGGWTGRFYPAANELTIDGYAKVYPAIEVWRGKVPPMGQGGYNAAIEWIKEQIK